MTVRTSLIIVSCFVAIGCSSSEDQTPAHPQHVDSGQDAAAEGDASEVVDAAALPDAAAEAGENERDAGLTLVGAPDCAATAPLTCPDPSPHWNDVYPIFMRRCVACHNGAGGEWPLGQYEHVADWYGEIRAQMLACTMPPPDAGIEMPLEERQTILSWIRCGFPK